MKKAFALFCAGLFCAALGLAALAADKAAMPGGTWKLSNWTLNDSVSLRLSYHERGTHWEWGTTHEISDFKGLEKDQLRSLSTPVAFTLERDAGVFFFEGTVILGVGRGNYHFVASPSYAAKLAELGYETIDGQDSSLMFLAVRDLSFAYAKEVKRLGIANLKVPDLVRFLDHGIDLEFMRELAATGYPGLTADDIILLRDHGIDAPYIARIQAAGFKGVTVDQIVQLHDHGVD
jgi:hypothetical protein